MIDFAGLVGKITGKAPGQTEGGLATGGDAGGATGGAFAELVRLATQAGTGRGEGNLRLVVDNGVAANVVAQETSAGLTSGIGDPLVPVGDGDGDAESDSPETSDAAQTAPPAPLAGAAVTMPVPVLPPMTSPVAASGSGPVAGSAPASVSVATPATSPSGQAAIVANRPAQAVLALVDQPSAPLPAQAAVAVAVVQAAGQDVAEQAVEPATLAATAATATGSAAEEASQPIRPGMLTAAWRLLASRQRGVATEGKADATAAPAAAIMSRENAGHAGSGEAPTGSATMAGAATSAVPSSLDGAAVSTSSSLRSIVEALPPVLQSDLGTAAVRVATGPSTAASTGEALGDQVIDMGVSGQWIDRMAREIAGLADGTGHSRFTLNPPHLGRLQVDLWRDGGTTSVRMLTETDEAAHRLNEGRSALQADARVAALSLGSITVEKSGSAPDSGARQDGGQRQGSDPFGQQADGQAQARAGTGQGGGQGNGQAGGQASGQGSDWVSRIARDEPNQQDDAASRAPERAANGRVRFA